MIKLFKRLIIAGLLWMPTIAMAATYNPVEGGLQDSRLRLLFPILGPSSSSSLPALIASIIEILLFIAGAIAVLFVVIGGYYWMTAKGNDEQAEKGRKTLTNAIIGIVVVIMAYVIINVIVRLVSYGTVY